MSYALQLLSGIVMVMNYTCSVDLSTFMTILLESEYGYLFRNIHGYGVSLLMLLLYCHLIRGLLYNSYRYLPTVWFSGITILLCLIVISFLGYVLPFGQMSYWAGTVVCNLLQVKVLINLLLGGYSLSLISLKRFLLLHFILPFIVLVFIILHLFYLHASSNIIYRSTKFTFMLVVDIRLFIQFSITVLALVLLNMLQLIHSDNGIVVDYYVTPLHIVPELYLLPFYSILKTLPNKVVGFIGLIVSIIVLFASSCSCNKLFIMALICLFITGAQLPHIITLSINYVLIGLYFALILNVYNERDWISYYCSSSLDCESYIYLSPVNHKILGLYYLWLAVVFGGLATVFSIIIRLELYSSGIRFIVSESFYNMSFTVHGVLMIFFFAMPGIYSSFGNYLLPLVSGTCEVSYPRINNIAMIMLVISYAIILIGIATEIGNGIATGWTLYPPLSSTGSKALNWVLLGLLINGISSLMSAANFIITCLYNSFICLISWSFILSSVMLIVSLPLLTGGVLMLITDMQIGTNYYDPVLGDPVLFQHLFWFFGHPEVYVLVLPAFGLVSHILSRNSKPVFHTLVMIFAMCTITILGCIVWAHHLFTVGLESDTRSYFTAVTIMISIPTGTKLFHWILTFLGSKMKVNPSILLVLMFMMLFTLGGTTGVILGNGAIDIACHDTYYVVGHFHFVLSLGVVISFISGLTVFNSRFTGNIMNAHIMYVFIILLTISLITTFIPQHFLGFNVMPRRMLDYTDYVNSWNSLSTLGSLASSLSIIFYALLTLNLNLNNTKVYFKKRNGKGKKLIIPSIFTGSLIFGYVNNLFLLLSQVVIEHKLHKSNVYLLVLFLVVSEFLLFITFFLIALSIKSSHGVSDLLPIISSMLIAISILSNFNHRIVFLCLFGIFFTMLQVSEYCLLWLLVSDSLYSSTIFLLTSVHFTHVLLGILIINVNVNNYLYCSSRRLPRKLYVQLKASFSWTLLYWHLVEALWLFIDITLYTL